jgi:hypothetical protein
MTGSSKKGWFKLTALVVIVIASYIYPTVWQSAGAIALIWFLAIIGVNPRRAKPNDSFLWDDYINHTDDFISNKNH